MNKSKTGFISIWILLLLSACGTEPEIPEASMPVYTGEALRNIFYPLGGIGTGNILLGGRGNILEMEIFGTAARDELPPHMTFYSLWYESGDGKSGVRILEREHFDDYGNPFGLPRLQLAGLPRFSELTWSGAPPEVELNYKDEDLPLQVALRAFNPLVPLDVEASSLPVAQFTWELHNPGRDSLRFALALHCLNPFKNLNYRSDKPAHPVRNSRVELGGNTGLYMESLVDPGHPDYGNMAIVAQGGEVEVQCGISSEAWWDDAHILWNAFRKGGQLPRVPGPVTERGRREVVASVLVRGVLAPGESTRIPYTWAWHVPSRALETSQSFGAGEIRGHIEKNYYATRYEDSGEILEYYLERERDLHERSLRFASRMQESSLPLPVRDAALSNLAALKSNLLSRMENGDLHAWEGMGNDFGCCPGNCTHVWNYAQTLAALFPSLERNIRETAFQTQTFSSGYQCFRTTFPLEGHYFRNVAADGQMGNIMRVYREWKYSGDDEWLEDIWPDVSRALEYAWHGSQPGSREWEWVRSAVAWDPERKGILRGLQHNTYDVNFYGPNMFTTGLYLGALRACYEMALHLEDERAAEYLEVFERGRSSVDSLLWNGAWYEQEMVEGHEKYQFGSGCLSDQLLAQYLAFNSGMGYIFDREKVDRCLQSIYRNNYIASFRDYENVQRVYALNGEGGLVLCSWPDGRRDEIPFPYADEVWTGVEYQVAASLVRAGMVAEGAALVEAVRNRYAGFNRNPYSEIESGNYYARALASWAVFQAFSGIAYDGSADRLSFAPPAADPAGFSFFWSTGTAWGNISSRAGQLTLEVDEGTLGLKELVLPFIGDPGPAEIRRGEELIDFRWDVDGTAIAFPEGFRLNIGQKLYLKL